MPKVTPSIDLEKLDLDSKKFAEIEAAFQEYSNFIKRKVIEVVSKKKSGHTSGCMSMCDVFLAAYLTEPVSPANIDSPDRTRIIMSPAHLSALVYSVLGTRNFFPLKEFEIGFREAGSKFSGHAVRDVNGVEVSLGALGQGLSYAAGIAQALKLKKNPAKVIVFLSDGELEEGQTDEAVRFILKYNLNNILAVVDANNMQIDGHVSEIMPSLDIAAKFTGFHVIQIDGHNLREIFQAYKEQRKYFHQKPVVIIAHTVPGKGVPFMEHKCKYHGNPLSPEEREEALNNSLPLKPGWKRRLKSLGFNCGTAGTQLKKKKSPPAPVINCGERIVYSKTENPKGVACRDAFGKAVSDLMELNAGVVALFNDLGSSVKLGSLAKSDKLKVRAIQGGVAEGNLATVAAGMSLEGLVPIFAGFAVFNTAQTAIQNFISGYNRCNVKIVSTHCGLNLGEDGATHQFMDYISVAKSWKCPYIFMPADANQTDAIIRHAVSLYGNCYIGMGRSRVQIITKETGDPFFDRDYVFKPGRADIILSGSHGYIITYGSTVAEALRASELLFKQHGLRIGIINMASIVPLDEDAVVQAAQTGLILTCEDHSQYGLAADVAMVLATRGINCNFKSLYVQGFGHSGKPDALYHLYGIDSQNIVNTILKMLKLAPN